MNQIAEAKCRTRSDSIRAEVYANFCAIFPENRTEIHGITYTKFSPKVLLPFFEGMAISYTNATVRLSNDEVGEIVFIDAKDITRPVVKVGHGFIDLKKNKNIHIQEVL